MIQKYLAVAYFGQSKDDIEAEHLVNRDKLIELGEFEPVGGLIMNDGQRFSGDMSRNEVEMDLNKFMAMVQEIGELKQKIMELENDKEPDNPWQNWIWLSKHDRCLENISKNVFNGLYSFAL